MLVDTSDGCKYVGQSGLAAMLAVKRSAGVAPEVNLRNSAQARKHASESTLALKPRADVTRSPKQGYQWPHKKDMCPVMDNPTPLVYNVPVFELFYY